jgi:hypothetical protein
VFSKRIRNWKPADSPPLTCICTCTVAWQSVAMYIVLQETNSSGGQSLSLPACQQVSGALNPQIPPEPVGALHVSPFTKVGRFRN